METEKVKLSDEQMKEKQDLIIELADDLRNALRESKIMKQGRHNPQVLLDCFMGIGIFTASILDAAERALKGADMSDYYIKVILPSSKILYDELQNIAKNKEEDEKINNNLYGER